MSAIALPHAAALARELEVEVQRLDALQQKYAQQLVDQLSDISFSETANGSLSVLKLDRYLISQAYSACPVTDAFRAHWKSLSLRTEFASSKTADPSACSSPWEDGILEPMRASGQEPLAAATSSSVPVGRKDKLPTTNNKRSVKQAARFQRTKEKITKNGQGTRQRSASPPTVNQVPPPYPYEEEARRARRALRWIREDRDAHFNAKERRAQELLKEGREAVRKSRGCRLTDSLSAPNPRKTK